MTPARQALTALLERVEGSVSGDRELDAEICATFRVLSPAAETERWARDWGGPIIARAGRVWLAHDDGSTGMHCDARPVTSSVDAALALAERVMPGVWWLVGKGQTRGNEPPYGAQLLFGSDEVIGEGESLGNAALAICAAILRAQLSTLPDETEASKTGSLDHG